MKQAGITHVIMEVSSHGLDQFRVDGCHFNLGIFILVLTAGFIWHYGIDYLVIFLASVIFQLVMEGTLTLSGLRKGEIYLYGRKLSSAANVCLRSLVDGPGLCVAAFFVADQFLAGSVVTGIIGSVVV
jgi:hypothetical protein